MRTIGADDAWSGVSAGPPLSEREVMKDTLRAVDG
jgi:hypothetical protein